MAALMITSAVALLQPRKGATVALQWQLGMHGFEPSKLRRLANLQSPVPASTTAGNANEHVRAG
jgi:GH24 family phage-related lysozyme (muramidase)